MLTFITPEALEQFVKDCGGNSLALLDRSAAFLHEHQQVTVMPEDADEDSGAIDKAPYVLTLGNNKDKTIFTVGLTNALDSGDCGAVEVAVRKGAPDFVITNDFNGSKRDTAQEGYRLNVVATQDGAFVSAEEPFDNAGTLEQIPHEEDLISPLAVHILNSRYGYKSGHFLPSQSEMSK